MRKGNKERALKKSLILARKIKNENEMRGMKRRRKQAAVTRITKRSRLVY